MARTPTVTRDQVPEKYREAFDHEVAISTGAIESGPGSVMINSPEMRKRANHLVFYFRQESELPQKIQEMAMILTARDKDCQYIWYAHAARARQEGISNEFVDALRDKKPLPKLPNDEQVLRDAYLAMQKEIDASAERRYHLNRRIEQIISEGD